jgi:hypothetical protein
VTHEIGGQGITRLRAIDDRLWATDSDAPLYGGFGLTGAPFEDYVFTSDRDGAFSPPAPAQGPPANTRVLPLAFHVFDVIRYRGAVVATGGTIARSLLEDRPLRGTRYPAGVFAGRITDDLLTPRFTLGEGEPVGVVRGTYMHRFGGRLYIGLHNNERRVRWDLAVLTGDPLDPATPDPVLARVTPDGGWLTRRMASAGGALYWIASGYRRDSRGGALFASADGRAFTRVALPANAGAPQDMAVVGDVRYLLTTAGLYRAGPADGERYTRIAAAPPGDPFGAFDSFCSAPLAGYADALWAGSTRDGAVYRVVPTAPTTASPPAAPSRPRAPYPATAPTAAWARSRGSSPGPTRTEAPAAAARRR